MAAPETTRPTNAYNPSTSTESTPLVVRSELPRNLPPGLQNLLKNLQILDKCTDWSDVKAILDSNFTSDFYWDSHFFKISGRDKVRPVWTAFTSLARVFSDPQLVRVVSSGKTIMHVEIESQLRYHFNRYILLPMTYFIPDAIVDCTCTVMLRLDKVCGIKMHYHNLPSLPWFVRAPVGWGVGLSASLAEPMVLMLYKWYETSKEAAASTARPVLESDVVRNVVDKVDDVTEPIKEKIVNPISEKASAVTHKMQELMT